MIPEERAALAEELKVVPRRSRHRSNWAWRLGLLAMAAAVTYSSVSFMSLTTRLNLMRQDAAGLQRSLFEQQRQGQTLQQEIRDLQTDAYIEKVAREQYHMTKPGEIRYLTGDASGLPVGSPTRTAP